MAEARDMWRCQMVNCGYVYDQTPQDPCRYQIRGPARRLALPGLWRGKKKLPSPFGRKLRRQTRTPQGVLFCDGAVPGLTGSSKEPFLRNARRWREGCTDVQKRMESGDTDGPASPARILPVPWLRPRLPSRQPGSCPGRSTKRCLRSLTVLVSSKNTLFQQQTGAHEVSTLPDHDLSA